MPDRSSFVKEACLEIEVQQTSFILHPYKGLYWKAEKLLIVSDLHLGKVQHFRNAGIYVPTFAGMDNYERLATMLIDFAPKTLLFLGDLFHSDYNRDWANFCTLRDTFAAITFALVPGNHDIVDSNLYLKNNINLLPEQFDIGAFTLSHYPLEECEKYNIAGHLHPGIRLVGEGLQTMKLPAFYFGKKTALMPSFGTFTGMSLVTPKPGDQVVAISDDQLFRLDTV